MKRILTILSLAFVMFSTVSLFDNGTVVQDICAQTTVQRGISCQQQYSACSTLNSGGVEYGNLLEDIISDTIKFQGYPSKSRLIDVVKETYDTGSTKISTQLCYRKDRIQYITSVPILTSSGGGDLVHLAYHGAADLNRSMYAARSCAPGLQPTMTKYEGLSNIIGNDVEFWGCCPTNYRIVGNPSSINTPAEVATSAACCLETGGAGVPYAYDNDVNKTPFSRCLTKTGEQVWTQQTSNGLETVIPYNQEASTIKLRADLVGGASSSQVIRISPTANSALKCPATASCALTSENLESVINPSRFGTEANLTCNRCYVEGDVMGYTSSPADGFLQGYVGFCKAGTMEKRPLINGSITDTVEYYLTDPTNQPLLAACKASGGIYTAIGCVDPTPMGIITGLIRISLGVIGGVALLQLIYVGIQYQMGDEAKIKEARSRLIATITGVAVLIFSILILRIIGVNILDVLPTGAI